MGFLIETRGTLTSNSTFKTLIVRGSQLDLHKNAVLTMPKSPMNEDEAKEAIDSFQFLWMHLEVLPVNQRVSAKPVMEIWKAKGQLRDTRASSSNPSATQLGLEIVCDSKGYIVRCTFTSIVTI